MELATGALFVLAGYLFKLLAALGAWLGWQTLLLASASSASGEPYPPRLRILSPVAADALSGLRVPRRLCASSASGEPYPPRLRILSPVAADALPGLRVPRRLWTVAR